MILFILFYKIKTFAQNLKNLWKLLIGLVFFLVSGLYGYLFGKVSDSILTGEINFTTQEIYTNYLLIIIFVFTLLRMIIPNYKPMDDIFPKYFPITNIERYLISIINDFLNSYFLYLIVFVLVFSFNSTYQTGDFLLASVVMLIAAQLIRRSIQYFVDFNLKMIGKIIPLLVIIVAFQMLVSQNIIEINKIQLFLFVSTLLITGYIQESVIIETKKKYFTNNSISGNITLKLLINNKNARLILVIGFIVKVFFVSAGYFISNSKSSNNSDDIFFWIFISAVYIFTYVFNNTWGFWKNIWLNYELRNGDYKAMMKQSFFIMLIPLSIDFIVTIPTILITSNLKVFALSYYFTSTIFLVLLSFLWSFLVPKKINSGFQMGGTVSLLSAIVSGGGVFLLITMKYNPWFYLLIPLYIIIGLIVYFISPKIYLERKFQILNKLTKQ